jgi:hypothetical protein
MPSILRSPSPSERPIDILRAAISWARLHGIHIELGAYNVDCGSMHERAAWWVTPGKNAVDPLGAVVLMRQPAARHLPDAPAEALGVHVAEVEGMAAGLDKQAPSGAWLGGLRRHEYLRGFETGVQLRMALLTAVCVPHNQRFRLTDGCPMCEEIEITALDREPV